MRILGEKNFKNNFELISFLCISNLRKELFLAIADGDKFPSQLQKILEKPFPTISTNLKELC